MKEERFRFPLLVLSHNNEKQLDSSPDNRKQHQINPINSRGIIVESVLSCATNIL